MPIRPSPSTLAAAALLIGLAWASAGHGTTSSDAPAAAPTPPAPVPTPSCDDGLLGTYDTCESCPTDCQPSTCKTKGRRTITVDLTPQSGWDTVGAVTVLIGYRKGVLSLPGEQSAPAVKARVRPRPAGALVFVNDLGYALRVVVSKKEGLPAGPLLDVDLDICSGAPAAQVGDLSCRVESCAQGGGKLPDCTCSVSLP